MWLHVRDGHDRREPGDLERDERLDLVRGQPDCQTAESGTVVIAGMRADLYLQLTAALGCRDRDRCRSGIDTASDVGAVDLGEDLLVGARALAEVGIEVQLWAVSP